MDGGTPHFQPLSPTHSHVHPPPPDRTDASAAVPSALRLCIHHPLTPTPLLHPPFLSHPPSPPAMSFSSPKLLLALALCLCLAMSTHAASSPLLDRLASQTAHRVRTQAVTGAPSAVAVPAATPTPMASAASAAAVTFSQLPRYAAPAARSLSNGVKALRSMPSLSLARRMEMSTADLSTGAIIGIVIGGVVFLLLVSALCFHRRHVYYSGGGSTTVVTGGAPAQGATVVRS